MINKEQQDRLDKALRTGNLKAINCIKQENKSTSTSFLKFITGKMQEFRKNDVDDRLTTRLTIAQQLGYTGDAAKKTAETLKKIINTPGYTTNRDRIILICLALKCSALETDRALYLYEMIPLRPEIFRELIIITALQKGYTIEETNAHLIQCNEQPLSFEKTKHSKKQLAQNNNFHCSVLESNVITYDRFNSPALLEKHNPSNYLIEVTYKLINNASHEISILSSSNIGGYLIDTESTPRSVLPICYNSYEEIDNPEFIYYFSTIDSRIEQAQRNLLAILDDTRNYNIRFDFDINEKGVSPFIETFNYTAPEEVEYYQLQKINSEYVLTVTNTSVFLSHHLGGSYTKLYGVQKANKIIEQYNSIYAIETSDLSKFQKNNRVKIYTQLTTALRDLYKRIREKEILLYDASLFITDDEDIAKYFGLTDFYTFEINEDTGAMEATDSNCLYTTQTGSIVQLNINELYDAITLGFPDVETLVSVKESHYNIYDIFAI